MPDYRNDSRRTSGYGNGTRSGGYRSDRYRGGRDERRYGYDDLGDGLSEVSRGSAQRSSRTSEQYSTFSDDARLSGSSVYDDLSPQGFENSFDDSLVEDNRGQNTQPRRGYDDNRRADNRQQRGYDDDRRADNRQQRGYDDDRRADNRQQRGYDDDRRADNRQQRGYDDRRRGYYNDERSSGRTYNDRFDTPLQDSKRRTGQVQLGAQAERYRSMREDPVIIEDDPAHTRQKSSGWADSVLEKLSGIFGGDSRKTMIALIITAFVIVALAVTLILVLSSRSCGGHSGVPVIEQGDGEEAGFVEETGGEVITISNGDVTISENVNEVDDFVVTVKNADGTYNRTGGDSSNAATLKISGQDETGFSFTIKAGSGSTGGIAYFCSANAAVSEISLSDAEDAEAGTLNFTFEEDGIKVYSTAVIPSLGTSADGTYISGTPKYDDVTAADSQFDIGLKDTQAIQTTLKDIMSSGDFALMNEIFSKGTCPVYQGAEKTVDKNGRDITVDAQMQSIKYYAFIPGTGEELILICSNGGMVYIGICDGSSYRYYTNDSAFKTTAPTSISGQAQTKSMTLDCQ